MFKEGSIVSRKKYNNDIIFKIVKIDKEIYYLKGLNVRLYASADKEDLVLEENIRNENDEEFLDDINEVMNRNDYFYIPGKILHIDADEEYLNRCLKLYKKANLVAYGIVDSEDNFFLNIDKYLNDINPDIVIITGHDAYYKKKGQKDNIESYKNSKNFTEAVKAARNYEKSYEKLKIIAGACQSDYESLINSGANFASSPKRVNIHALDPAIIAIGIALTENTKELDVVNLIDKTKCKKEGFGGIKTYGSMYVGYPK